MANGKSTRKQTDRPDPKRTKLTLRKETLRDLTVRDGSEIKGGLSLKPIGRTRKHTLPIPQSGQC